MINHKNNFDFLRFLAAAAVIYSHSFAISLNDYALDPLVSLSNNQISFGDLAVAVFFIISGFLITQSYDVRKDPIYFLKARILRIFPALIVVIVLTVFILGPIVTTLSISEYFKNVQTYSYLKNIFLYPLHYYLPGVFESNIMVGVINGSIWTLAYEIACYMIVFILGLFRILTKQIALILLFVVLCLSSMNELPLNEFTYRLLYLGCYFIAGMVMYFYREHIKVNYLYALISVIVLVVSANYGGLVKMAIPIFMSYLIYFIAFLPTLKVHNFTKYGDASYGMYIYAFPVQQILVQLYGGSMNPVINMILSLLISVLCGYISYHLVEKNAMKLRYFKFKQVLKSNKNKNPVTS